MRFFSLLLTTAAAFAATPVTFKLAPVNIGNGYVISGTVTTDGTVGYLAPVNLVKWNVMVTQTTDQVFTEKNTTAANVSGVTTDGKKIYVPTSPDGFTDGGNLSFLGAATRGNIPSGSLVADFTGMNVAGGGAGWQTPLALNIVPLNQLDGTIYTAASAVTGKPNVFNITKVSLSLPTDPVQQTLIGTITTDGTVGALGPRNFRSWHIVGREQSRQIYTEMNSVILNLARVFSDNSQLKLDNPGGILQVGVPMLRQGGRPLIVTVADFTDPAFPNGVSSYYYGWQGLVSWKTPLTTSQTYVAARK